MFTNKCPFCNSDMKVIIYYKPTNHCDKVDINIIICQDNDNLNKPDADMINHYYKIQFFRDNENTKIIESWRYKSSFVVVFFKQDHLDSYSIVNGKQVLRCIRIPPTKNLNKYLLLLNQ